MTVYKHAPIKTLSKKEKKFRSKPWLTRGIITSIRTKNNMFKLAIRNKSKSFSDSFKKYRNLLTRLKDLSKKLYFKDSVKRASGNSKQLWRTVNNIITTKSPKHKSIDCVEDNEGKFISDPIEISNTLNNNFISIADNLLSQNNGNSNIEHSSYNNSQYSSCKHINSFFLSPIKVEDIKNYIDSMNKNKSSRSDIPNIQFIKLSVDIIAPVISNIFNHCILKGVFPESLKIAEVIPIFKSGSKSDINNYRPISLLSPFSKIFENHIYNQLNYFIKENNIFHKLQYGFREDSSTELAVSQIVDDIIETIDNKLINCSIFLDLAKAFNTINHNILLKKLENYGIRGIPLSLIKSFLENRSQWTSVGTVKSDLKLINVGVPQGSSLGPLLFLFYINDLPLSTKLKVRLFADDACLSYQHSDATSLNNIINQELNKVSHWLHLNKLFINYSKSSYLIFNRTKLHHKFHITIDNKELQHNTSTKYLGVIIDDKLNWKPHITQLTSKLSRNCYALTKLKAYVDEPTLKTVYYGLIYPHIQYCISSYGNTAASNLESIIKLHKRVIRNICDRPARSDTHQLFCHLQMLKIKDIHKLQLAKLMHKYKDKYDIGNNHSVKLSDQHNYNTRLSSNDNYFMPRSRTNLGLRSFRYNGPKLWQTVPLELKNLNFPLF